MAGITLAQAEAQLAAWLAADSATAGGQAYTISTGGGSRSLTRANAAEIRENIKFWNQQVQALSRTSGGMRVRGATIVS